MTRRRIRAQFTEWVRAQGIEPAAHHRLLATELQALAEGKNRLLLIFMPPGSAKSTYTSVLFPAWYLAQPDAGNIIAASHSQELARRFGRKVRGLVRGNSVRLGYGLDSESQAADRWATTHGREYMAAGAGMGIAGFRSKLNIVDDPFRNRQDAESQLIRDRIWEWWNDDLETRLVPGGGSALVMTRWHEDDLAGRLIERAKVTGEPIKIISIPAIAEADDPLGRKPGEWLWEGPYGYADRLREKHKTTDARGWASLYQQRPSPESGDFFRRPWFREYETAPARGTMRVYGASDYAVTADGGDWTVHLVIGVDPRGDLYLLDLWRGQTASDEWVNQWCNLVEQWQPDYWAEEQGQIRSGVGPFRDQVANERRAWTVLEAFPTRGDKAVRAQSIRGRISMRGLYVPKHRPFTEPFISELLSFPAGKHDDQVDALGLFGQLLDKVDAGPTEAPPERLPQPEDIGRWRQQDDDSWRL